MHKPGKLWYEKVGDYYFVKNLYSLLGGFIRIPSFFLDTFN